MRKIKQIHVFFSEFSPIRSLDGTLPYICLIFIHGKLVGKYTSPMDGTSLVRVTLKEHTVDGRNPANQLKLVVYAIIYRVLYIQVISRISEPSTVSLYPAPYSRVFLFHSRDGKQTVKK